MHFFYFLVSISINNKTTDSINFSNIIFFLSYYTCKKKPGKYVVDISLSSLSIIAYAYLNTQKLGIKNKDSYLSVYTY